LRAGPAAAPAAAAGNPWLAEPLRLQRLGRHGEVAELARTRLRSSPQDVDALQLLGVALLAQGKSADGLDCLRRAAALVPDSAECQTLLATVLSRTGDYAGAIAGYRTATRLRPGQAENWGALAQLLKALSRYDEAEDCCRSGLAADPRHAALRR